MKGKFRIVYALPVLFALVSCDYADCGPAPRARDWRSANLGDVKPVLVTDVAEANPSKPAMLGWSQDGRIALALRDQLWLVSVPDGETETVTLSRSLDRSLPYQRGAHPVFDWNAAKGTFIVSDLVAKRDDVGESWLKRVVEFDSATGDVLRIVPDLEHGGSVEKAAYVAGGEAIAAVLRGAYLPNYEPAKSSGVNGVVEVESQHLYGAGETVMVTWGDGTEERLSVDALDMTTAPDGHGFYVTSSTRGNRFEVLGKLVYASGGTRSIYYVDPKPQNLHMTLKSEIYSLGRFVPAGAQDSDDVFLELNRWENTTDGSSMSMLVKFDGESGELEPLAAYRNLLAPGGWSKSWEAVVPGRGLFVALQVTNSWHYWWLSLDGSRRYMSLNEIVPAGSDVRFSEDGRWMAVMADNDLRVYAVEDLVEIADE